MLKLALIALPTAFWQAPPKGEVSSPESDLRAESPSREFQLRRIKAIGNADESEYRLIGSGKTLWKRVMGDEIAPPIQITDSGDVIWVTTRSTKERGVRRVVDTLSRIEFGGREIRMLQWERRSPSVAVFGGPVMRVPAVAQVLVDEKRDRVLLRLSDNEPGAPSEKWYGFRLSTGALTTDFSFPSTNGELMFWYRIEEVAPTPNNDLLLVRMRQRVESEQRAQSRVMLMEGDTGYVIWTHESWDREPGGGERLTMSAGDGSSDVISLDRGKGSMPFCIHVRKGRGQDKWRIAEAQATGAKALPAHTSAGN